MTVAIITGYKLNYFEVINKLLNTVIHFLLKTFFCIVFFYTVKRFTFARRDEDKLGIRYLTKKRGVTEKPYE
jgi:hypothetical protein